MCIGNKRSSGTKIIAVSRMTLRSNIFAMPYIAQSLFLWPSAYRKGRHAVRTDRNAPQDRVTKVDCRMSTGLCEDPGYVPATRLASFLSRRRDRGYVNNAPSFSRQKCWGRDDQRILHRGESELTSTTTASDPTETPVWLQAMAAMWRQHSEPGSGTSDR